MQPVEEQSQPIEEAKEVPMAMEEPAAAVMEEEKPDQAAGGEVEAADTDCGSQLKAPSDLKGFPVFPAGTKSLLSKHLSRDIWKELKDSKDSFGYTFREAILSGCQNVDSGIGVYAGSHDSYTQFASLLDLVVEDYHKHGKKDKHISNMDAS